MEEQIIRSRQNQIAGRAWIYVIPDLRNPEQVLLPDISNRAVSGTDECGLLSLAFDPNDASHRYFCVWYALNTTTAVATGDVGLATKLDGAGTDVTCHTGGTDVDGSPKCPRHSQPNVTVNQRWFSIGQSCRNDCTQNELEKCCYPAR